MSSPRPHGKKVVVISGTSSMNHTGTPDGIASTVTLQLSERTGWVTGAVCHVDGGVTAGRNRSTSVAE